MNDYEYADFRMIRDLLEGSAHGKRLTYGFKKQRYMIVLFAASHLSNFEEHYTRDKEGGGFTIYALMKVAKHLQYSFDRSKSASKIFSEQEEQGMISKKMVLVKKQDKMVYSLTKKGESYCRKQIQGFLDMGGISPQAWEPYTVDANEKWEKMMDKLNKMKTLEEKTKWLQRNPGALFSQPTEEEHKLGLLLRKIESL